MDGGAPRGIPGVLPLVYCLHAACVAHARLAHHADAMHTRSRFYDNLQKDKFMTKPLSEIVASETEVSGGAGSSEGAASAELRKAGWGRAGGWRLMLRRGACQAAEPRLAKRLLPNLWSGVLTPCHHVVNTCSASRHPMSRCPPATPSSRARGAPPWGTRSSMTSTSTSSRAGRWCAQVVCDRLRALACKRVGPQRQGARAASDSCTRMRCIMGRLVAAGAARVNKRMPDQGMHALHHGGSVLWATMQSGRPEH